MALFKKKDTTKKTEAKAEDKKEKKAVAKAEAAPKVTGNAYRVLIRPIVTEKSSAMGSRGVYVFAVDPKANKLEIKAAIKSLYGVEPERVRVINLLGKPVRARAGFGRRKDWKKAVVTLPKGKSIDVFANA